MNTTPIETRGLQTSDHTLDTSNPTRDETADSSSPRSISSATDSATQLEQLQHIDEVPEQLQHIETADQLQAHRRSA
jgi:hypothetical protein